MIASNGGERSVSTRHRLGLLAGCGDWDTVILSAGSLPQERQVDSIVAAGDAGALLVLQRVIPSPARMIDLRAAYDWIVFDIDDAIYATPPDVQAAPLVATLKQARRLVLRGSTSASSRRRPLAHALRHVDVCVVGNPILGDFARRFAERVAEIPTTVEPVEHPPATRGADPVLVWLGVQDNLQYLELIRAPLGQVARETGAKLRVVSGATWRDAPLEVDFVPYSEEAARHALLTATVGLSPLTDDPWTRGKCALRVIQYGGNALPAVATPVGITDRVVTHGETGFLASGPDDWVWAMRTLLNDRTRAAEVGARALTRISHLYSDDVARRLWKNLIGDLPPPKRGGS